MTQLPNRPASRILRAAEADQWIDGYAFLQAARDEAERVRRDSELSLQEARDLGFAEARRQGDARVIECLARATAQVDAYLAGLETALVDLALGVVRHVLDDLDHFDLLLGCTRKALQGFRQDQQMTLFVPPSELDALRERLNNDPLDWSSLTLEGDARLAEGEARLGGPVGWVDIGLDAQLENIRSSLLPFAEERAP
ncbi:FliH/SctL family protein [Pseudomonas fluorescens]|uniref:FliH/SctL family protein n=1 Tax=Pseudomonas fluorescens TaxID=294 RepID=UPI0038091A72